MSYRQSNLVDVDDTPVRKSRKSSIFERVAMMTPTNLGDNSIVNRKTPRVFLSPAMEMLINRMSNMALKTPLNKRKLFSLDQTKEKIDESFVPVSESFFNQVDSEPVDKADAIRKFLHRHLSPTNINVVRGSSRLSLDNNSILQALEREHERRESLKPEFFIKKHDDNDEKSTENVESSLPLCEKSMECLKLEEEPEENVEQLEKSLASISNVLFILSMSNAQAKKFDGNNSFDFSKTESNQEKLEEEKNPEERDLGDEILRQKINEQFDGLITDEQKQIIEDSFIQKLHDEADDCEIDDFTWWKMVSSIDTPRERKISIKRRNSESNINLIDYDDEIVKQSKSMSRFDEDFEVRETVTKWIRQIDSDQQQQQQQVVPDKSLNLNLTGDKSSDLDVSFLADNDCNLTTELPAVKNDDESGTGVKSKRNKSSTDDSILDVDEILGDECKLEADLSNIATELSKKSGKSLPEFMDKETVKKLEEWILECEKNSSIKSKKNDSSIKLREINLSSSYDEEIDGFNYIKIVNDRLNTVKSENDELNIVKSGNNSMMDVSSVTVYHDALENISGLDGTVNLTNDDNTVEILDESICNLDSTIDLSTPPRSTAVKNENNPTPSSTKKPLNPKTTVDKMLVNTLKKKMSSSKTSTPIGKLHSFDDATVKKEPESAEEISDDKPIVMKYTKSSKPSMDYDRAPGGF